MKKISPKYKPPLRSLISKNSLKSSSKMRKKNFKMFNYVNELSNEMEELEKQLFEVKEEIEHFSGPGNSADVFNRKKLRELEEKHARSENKSE